MKRKIAYTFTLSLLFVTTTILAQTYRIAVTPKGEKKWGYVNLKGEIIVEPLYYYGFDYTEDGTALVMNKGTNFTKIFLFDRTGNRITPENEIKLRIEEWTENVTAFNGGILRQKQLGIWGGMNTSGKISVSFRYNELTDFDSGYALGEREKKYYVVDKNGNEALIERNDEISYIKHFTEGLAPIELNNKYFGFVDTLGKIVIDPEYLSVGYFRGGFAWVRVKDKTIGFINKKGEWIIEPQFDVVEKGFDKVSALAMVKLKSSDAHWSYTDTTGKVTYFKIADKHYGYSEGLAVGRQVKKFGYLNNKGEWAILPFFDDAKDFKNGHAAVKLGKLWGIINKKGEWVLEPAYKRTGDVVKLDK